MFSPLAVDIDERVPANASSDLQIARDELRGFGDARAGIVEEEEEGVFDPAPRRPAVRNLEQRFHLGLAEPADRLRRCLLGGDGADTCAPLEMSGVAAGDEAGEGADRRQALVAGLRGAAAVILDMVEELSHAPGREIVHRKPLDRLTGLGADEREKEGEGVAVTLLRVAGEVALGDDVFGQEAAEPGAEGAWITHGLLR